MSSSAATEARLMIETTFFATSEKLCPGAVFAHRKAVGGIVELGVEARQPLALHQHQKALLGEIGGRRGRKSARPVLDGKAPVARKRRADRERRGGQAFRRQALH